MPANSSSAAPPAAGESGAPAGAAGERQVPYHSYFLSELLRTRVRFEEESRPFGRLYDIGAASTGMPYPLATALQVRSRGRGVAVIPWPDVLELSSRGIVVRKSEAAAAETHFWLRRDVLDDQVVDLSGARVVRVNDVHMLHAEGQLIIAHVAVGIRSILRRLGFERPVSALMRWLLDYTLKDSFVTWRNVELVAAAGAPGLLRVSGAPLRLAEIHPADLADIMEQLGARERQELLSRLPLGKAAEALGEVDPELQRALISREQPERAADILEEMPAKEAADVLRDLHQSDVQRIISRMEREAAQDIVTILSHRQESAGGMMATQCIEAKPQQRAAEVLEQVRSVADQVEVLNYAYVLDEEGRLLGVANLRQLMRAAPDSTMQSLMATDVVKVTPRTSVKDVARLFVRYGFRAIPVVDKRNVFLGAVRLMSVLEELSPLFKD